MLSRREFLKLSAALLASLALEPPVQTWELSIDQEMVEKAITVGGASRDLGRVNVICHIDVDAVFAAVRLVDLEGFIWTTKDQGKTWECPCHRATNPFSAKLKPS